MPLFSSKNAFEASSYLASQHYENFPVASFWVPARKRKAICMLYAFARTADDFADEPAFEGQREKLLLDFREKLFASHKGQVTDPFFQGLAQVMEAYALPVDLLNQLLEAFIQDVHQSRYQSWEEIVAYAQKSANPIGRLYLRIYGYDDPEMDALSDSICTALQFINFWQDVSVDLEKDRIYIPENEMKKCGVTENDLFKLNQTTSFKQMMASLVDRTSTLLVQGSALNQCVKGRLRLELNMMMGGGAMILDKIKKQDFTVLTHRPVLHKIDRMKLLFGAWRFHAR